MTVSSQPIPTKSVNTLALGFLVLLLPLIGHVDSWLLVVGALSAVLTWWRFQRQGRSMGKWLRLFLMLCLIAAFLMSQWGQFSVDTAASFFVLTLAFKWQEFDKRRDYYILFLILCYFAAVIFLFEQDLVWSLVVFAGVILLFMGLQRLLAGRSVPLAWRDIGILMLKVVPLMVLLFVFFPRMGPLWSVPLVSEKARTGLSDQMTPGDISDLAQSGERAFRATFGGEIPPQSELYWRALILDRFDGRTWRQTLSRKEAWRDLGRVNTSRGAGGLAPDEYEVLMDPTFQQWGFSLKGSEPRTQNVFMSERDLVRFPRPVDTPVQYRMGRAGDVSPEKLTREEWAFYTELPESGNPRTRQWVDQTLQEGITAQELVNKVASRFRNQAYFYTLSPPPMPDNAVDRLFFDYKRGFCAHYASALAFILRQAGVPARIVTGYLGGKPGLDEDYLIVRQYDAHGWVEAYLPEQGWQRLDPTAWIAPSRVEQGIDGFLDSEEGASEEDTRGYRDLPVVEWMSLRLDAMNYYWNRWVVGYQGDQQEKLLDLLPGGSDLKSLAMWTGGGFAVFVLVYTMITVWRSRKRYQSPSHRLFDRWRRWLNRMGVATTAGDTPSTLAEKAAVRYPEQARAFRGFARVLNELIFRPDASYDVGRAEAQLRSLMRYTRRSRPTSRVKKDGKQ